MKHGIKHRKLGRNTGHRKAFLRNLARQVLVHEYVTTTLPKAKEIRPLVERLITWGKKGTLAYRRKILAFSSGDLHEKLISDLGARYRDRNGGYTRITRAGFRYGDRAPLAVISLVESAPVLSTEAPKEKAPKKKAGPKETASTGKAPQKKAASEKKAPKKTKDAVEAPAS